MSPNVAMIRPGGLRSKPGRVLAKSHLNSSVGKEIASPSSGVKRKSSILSREFIDSERQGSPMTTSRTPLALHVTPRLPTSPISKFVLDRPSPLSRGDQKHRSSVTEGNSSKMLISEDNWTEGRISSLPSLEGWIVSSSAGSHMETPPKLDCPMEVLDGPSPMKIDFHPPSSHTNTAGKPALRKLGMAARPARVQIPTTTMQSSVEPSRNPSPTLKRFRAESHAFTSAPPPPVIQTKPGKQVKIEDLKKILAEHNQRIRPTKKR